MAEAEREPPMAGVRQAATPDAILPASLQRMEREAWHEFYLRYRRLVRGVLAGLTGYTEDLEDLTQQVFVTATTLVRSGRVVLHGDERGLRSWVAAIAVRIGHAELRRRRTAGLERTGGHAPIAVGPGLNPEAREVLSHAYRVWEKLPVRLRVPWLLRHLERMKLGEIARTLRISVATVKRRLLQADLRFRAAAKSDPVLREFLGNGADA